MTRKDGERMAKTFVNSEHTLFILRKLFIFSVVMIAPLILGFILFSGAVQGDSCSGRCDDYADQSKSCQCNSLCESKYHDCCSDYESVCKTFNQKQARIPKIEKKEMRMNGRSKRSYTKNTSSGSCAGRCEDNLDNKYSCQCNSQCERFGDCCSDYGDCSSGGNPGGNTGGGGSSGSSCSKVSVSNQDILDASDQLFLLDSNRAAESDIVVNPQAQTSDSSNKDNSPQPFFSYVNPDLLYKTTYRKLIDLVDNYHAVQGNDENFSTAQFAEQDSFLDSFVETEVGAYLYKFLSDKGYAGCGDVAEFKQLIKDIWFGLYSRKSGAMDTSGFEHVFVGEIKGSSVSGFHNWVSIYLQEQSGNLDYYGYTGYTDPSLWGLHFEWLGQMKGLSGSLVGHSPEYDIAVFSLCHLLRPDSQCSVTLRNADGGAVQQKIQTWSWSNSRPANDRKYVASAYFLA